MSVIFVRKYLESTLCGNLETVFIITARKQNTGNNAFLMEIMKFQKSCQQLQSVASGQLGVKI